MCIVYLFGVTFSPAVNAMKKQLVARSAVFTGFLFDVIANKLSWVDKNIYANETALE